MLLCRPEAKMNTKSCLTFKYVKKENNVRQKIVKKKNDYKIVVISKLISQIITELNLIVSALQLQPCAKVIQ